MPLTTNYKKTKFNQSEPNSVYVYGLGDSWVSVKTDTGEKSPRCAYDPNSLKDSKRAYKWAETYFSTTKG